MTVMTDRKGFSLIELLIVIALIGILTGIASISGKAWFDRSRIESQMSEMLMDLVNAQARSMAGDRNTHFVTFSSTEYVIYEDTNPASGGDDELQTASDKEVLRKSLNPRYPVDTNLPSPWGISFNNRGIVSKIGGSSIGTWYIWVTGWASYGSAYDCITIAATRIRMGKYNGANCIVK